ncbi:hypothetical protein R3P38DRAFT_2778595 [Favolaschia claudopus]|uniref:Uncharacterized protein n=1 Tax=Favolaschia claudopus TaxID=2862362 RepID=A0AAW0BHD1_9AGAR
MPEAREAKCSFIICDEYFGPILVKDGALPLERIDIDATEKEQKRFPKSHPAHQGLPYAIDSSCTAKRGTNNSRLRLAPPTLSLSLSSSSSISSPSPSPQLASLGTVAFWSTRLFLPLTAEPYTARQNKHLMPRECTELRPNSAKSQFVVPGNNIIWPNSPKWDNGQNFSNLLVTFGQLTAGGFS